MDAKISGPYDVADATGKVADAVKVVSVVGAVGTAAAAIYKAGENTAAVEAGKSYQKSSELLDKAAEASPQGKEEIVSALKAQADV